MRTSIHKTLRGQGTLELAMLLPIVFFLLYMTISAFRVHDKGSVANLESHQKKLALYDHGNGFMEFDGALIPEGSYGELFSPDSYVPDSAAMLAAAAGWAANLGINQLLNEIPFLDGTTLIRGYARGFVGTGARTFIDSGFHSVDYNTAHWGGLAGMAASDQATELARGFNPSRAGSSPTDGWRELMGSGVQAGFESYAQSQGDFSAAGAGAVGGILGSSTATNWLNDQSHEVIAGAARGALTSAAAGVFSGSFDWTNVRNAAAMGAFQTRTVAELIPFSGGLQDPRNSASFGAANSMVSTFLTHGSKVTFADLAVSGADGAFFSSQSSRAVTGEGHWTLQWGRSLAAGSAYGAGKAWAMGGDSDAVGMSALNSAMYSTGTMIGGKATGWFGDQVQSGSQPILGEESVEQVAVGASNDIDQASRSFENASSVMGSDGERRIAGGPL